MGYNFVADSMGLSLFV